MEYIKFKTLTDVLPRATSYKMFEELDGKQRVDLINDMIVAAHSGGVRGAAANQLGSNYRAIVINDEFDQPIILFGPRLTAFGGETLIEKESSLTYPGFEVEVPRHEKIRVTGHNLKGEVEVYKWSGEMARIFLHYFDHLEGRKFWMNSNKFHVDRAEKKWQLSKRKNKV